jgi:hypothetical protein
MDSLEFIGGSNAYKFTLSLQKKQKKKGNNKGSLQTAR